MKCAECGHSNPDKATQCEKCREPFDDTGEPGVRPAPSGDFDDSSQTGVRRSCRSLREGMEETLTVVKLALPALPAGSIRELRRRE